MELITTASLPVSQAVTSNPRLQHLIQDPAVRVARALDKRKQVLKFLRDEIWSSTENIASLLVVGYSSAHQLLKTMAKLKLVHGSEFYIAGARGAKRVVIYGITTQGLAFAWDADEQSENRTSWEPSKTNALFIPHNLMTQQARIKSEKLGWHSWKPSRLLMNAGLPKIPDGETISVEGIKVAVEIEREIKTDKRYEGVIGAYIAQIKNTKRWDRVDYLCPDADFAKRLAKVFARLTRLRLDAKNGQPMVVGELTQLHRDRFRFYAASEWPTGQFITAQRKS